MLPHYLLLKTVNVYMLDLKVLQLLLLRDPSKDVMI